MASGFLLASARSVRQVIANLQGISGPAVVINLTETITLVAAFCMVIYSLLLFYQGSIEYLSTRIQPHP